jgi:hypothetical protein
LHLHSHPRAQRAVGAWLGPRDQHDGYKPQVRRDGDSVRLFTRRGYDWSGRYPAIVVTAMQLRATSRDCFKVKNPDSPAMIRAREAQSGDAVDRGLSKYKLEPMDLANMRQNGVRSLEVMCLPARGDPQCRSVSELERALGSDGARARENRPFVD